MIDEELWKRCQELTKRKPAKLPAVLGRIEGNRVLVVDGNEVKLFELKKDDDADPMDFVEGANDQEASWVRRHYGRKVLLIDVNLAHVDWKFVLLHEAFERRLMSGGMTYPAAHKRANAMEREARIRARDGQRRSGT